MDQLMDTLRTVLESYTGAAGAAASGGILPDRRRAKAGLIVRLQGNRIIIVRDVNDRPLLEALLQAGVPRHQIILAYAGEAVNQPVD